MALVAAKMGRRYVGIEVSQEYVDMARKRIADAMPMFANNDVA